MLIPAPLPTWPNLFRALLRRPPSDSALASPWHREGEVVGWLSRSAWSLALIAQWRKNRVPGSQITVWIPDFFCNASLAPLRQTGANLVFYPLTDKMLPDLARCKTLAEKDSVDIFVLAHYFGQPTPAATARDFCTRHGAWLIEDAAHVLRPVEGVGAYGDFVLYSPHKHLPLPDGAVVVIRPNGPGKLGEEGLTSFGQSSTWPDQLRELQSQLGVSVNRSWIPSVVWLVKRVLQKFGVRSWARPTIPFAESLNPSQSISPPLTVASQSRLARRLLSNFLDLEAVARQRQRHQLLWDFVVLDNEDLLDKVSVAERTKIREWTPYLATYQVDPTTAELTHDEWEKQDFPTTTWPDLPPEVVMQQDTHANAWRLRHSRLYLPVHQSLSIRGVLRRCHRQKSVQECTPNVRLVWDTVTSEQWHQWMAQVDRSNLLQSWAYGEAKSAQGGWRVKRGVFYRDNEPIAFVQVLQKGVPGLLTVSRINRGPILLRPLQSQEQNAIWKELAPLGCLWRGRVLSVAPELTLTRSSLSLMGNMGFRQFSPRAYESVWVDLSRDLDTLRKQLDGKWRNMLVFSEKAGLVLEITETNARFDWMIARYQELMQANDFSGPPIDFLQCLRRHAGAEGQLPILCAVHDGELVAGVCLAFHGNSATYLLGWNGPKGRNLKANQYLLWQAIVYLKQAGMRWFDLGGISEEYTPGISSFKLGVNGEHYELVGEYWKW